MRPDGEVGAGDIQDALDVLGDLVEWRLTPARWASVTAIVEQLASALDAGDITAIRSATADLELASPLRLTGLRPSLVAPPPRRLYLIRNRLVHMLESPADGDRTPRSARDASRGPASTQLSGTGATITEELVVHVFAPLSGPGTSAAYRRISRLWDACGDVLAATEPVAGLGLPVTLPAEPPPADRPGDEAMAARRDATDAVQAIVRRLHDTVCLSVGLGGSGSTWAGCFDRWSSAADPGDDHPLLGTVTIFAGTLDDPTPEPSTARAVGSRLPGVSDDYWCDDAAPLAGTAMWEFAPDGDDRHRRLVVLGPPPGPGDPTDPVSTLVWTYGGPAPTPFTSYLWSAAKLRYEMWVRAASDAVVDGDPDAAERWLDRMSTTVAIARENMARCLGALGVDGESAGGPLGADFTIADTLVRQLDYDMRYVRNGTAGRTAPAPAAPRLGAPTFGLLTALAEEFTAMRGLIDDAALFPVADDPRSQYVVGTMPSSDPNRPHRVVLALLGETGNTAAAHAVAHLTRSFASVAQIVMVGIAAGVPAPTRPDQHVRLGDIVVGTWNVVDFDHIVDTPDGPQPRQQFPRRSDYLAARVKMLTANEMRGERPWEQALADLITRLGKEFARPPDDTDVLYASDAPDATPIAHPPRADSGHPKVHEGRIGSSDRSLRNIAARDELAARHDLRAIEMEGKGIGTASHADGRDWFVVRGISDYADSRLGKRWRKYAAAAAAAYVRALLAASAPVPPHGGNPGA